MKSNRSDSGGATRYFKTIREAAAVARCPVKAAQTYSANGEWVQRADGKWDSKTLAAIRETHNAKRAARGRIPTTPEMDDWKERKLAAQAQLAEHALQVARGNVVSIDSARDAIQELGSMVVANLQNLAQRLTTLQGLTPDAIHREISEASRRIQDGAAAIEIRTGEDLAAAGDEEEDGEGDD